MLTVELRQRTPEYKVPAQQFSNLQEWIMLTQRRYGIKPMTLKPSLIDVRRWYPNIELLLLISSSMTGNIPQQVDW
jgi:hypothetical protein